MNPLQRAAAIRKAIYLAAIVVLFTVSMVWRGMIPVPLGTSQARAAQPFRWAHDHTIQSQAQRLEVWELDPNETEADVSGSAARLALTGSRGLVVTALWLSAIEKQKRNDFHEFEQRVEAVTRLQPNFVTPWIFQSWNITYNVSVEMHGSGDMYYYIVRGIQLLAEGERRNKRSPDMRYQIAFYYQNKFGVSDQVETLRCLFDLSCIPPSDRNPDNLLKASPNDPGVKEIDYEAFRRFCARHPHFVRRLRGEEGENLDKRALEKLRARLPEDVVRFLRDNYRELPCRYRKDAKGDWTDELADPEPAKYFPVLPPQFNEGPGEAHPGIATATDESQDVAGYFSAFKAARAWFSYSLVLLPPPPKDHTGKVIPGPTPPPGVGGHDPSKHRVPRLPALIIFRQGAPRAQSYAAELEQKEGWFDGEGWRITGTGWFPDQPDGVVVGAGRAWSLEEWRAAAAMWRRHGSDYALSLDETPLKNLRTLANEASSLPPDASPDQLDENLRRRYVAAMAIQYYGANRSMTNFPFFLVSAEAEASEVNGRPITVLARKTLWQADQARKLGESAKAIRLYKEGLTQWKEVMEKNTHFHQLQPPDHGNRGEEETYEYELPYLRLLVQHDERVRNRANEVARAFGGVAPFLAVGVPFPKDAQERHPFWTTAAQEELKWAVVENTGEKDFRDIKDEAERKRQDFASPFVKDSMVIIVIIDNRESRKLIPWVREEVKESVRQKQGVSRAKTQPQPAEPQPGGPGPQPAPKTGAN